MAELLATEIFYALASAGIDITAATATAITIGSYVVVAGTAYAVAQSMIKAPAFGSLQSESTGKVQMTRDTVASRRVIYGTVRVSGPIVFVSTNGAKNEFLHMIVATAGHEVTKYHTIFFNDNIAFQDDAQNTALYPADRLAMTYKTGATSGQTAYAMEPTTEWTATDTLDGISSIYARMTADPKVFPNGIPNISAVITGRKIYDVDGTTEMPTSSYSNPALILNDYLRNYFGAANSEIDTGSFGTARDICDQLPFASSGSFTKRYTCNYSFTQNIKPSKVIEDMLKTCYGKLAYVNGKFVLKVGAYSTPVVSLNEDDIIGNINITTRSSQANSYNSVRGLFIDGGSYTSSFQAADFVPVTSPYYLAEDNNIESPIEIELSGVTDHTTARRIAKLNLLDSRQDLTVQLTTKISGLNLIAGDNVYLSLSRYGFDSKVFEVVQLDINSDLTVNLTLKETAATIYDFPVDEDVDRDLSPNTNLPSPFFVNTPIGFAVSESTTIDRDGTIFPSATMTWVSSLTGSVSDIEIDFKLTSSANYDTLGKFGRDTTTFTTIDVAAGATYNFRARNFNYLGVFSNYVSQSLKIVGDITRPQAPIGGASVGLTGSLYVTWTNSSVDRDYKFTQVWVNSSNNSASAENQGTVSGTSWNKTIVQSGSYYVWLKNIDTTGNESDISTGGNAFVSGIAQGAPGPAGPSGSSGFALTNIYRRTDTTPSTPTGNLPVSGWQTVIPADTGEVLWLSNGLISSADFSTLTGSWSTPTRLTGRLSYYSASQPTSGMFIGDLWFDTDDAMKVYRYNGSSWVSVQDANIPSITGSILTMTSSIGKNASDILSLTGSVFGLQTSVVSLSSSYIDASSSFNSQFANVYATYSTKDFAIAVAAQSSSVAFMSATASANANTNTLLGSYATKTYAETINAYSSSVTFMNATSSANAYTSTALGGYSTTNQSQAYSNTAITASVSQGGVVSASNAAAVAVNAAVTAEVSGSVVQLKGEYGVVVSAGKVTGFKILSTPTTSSFIIQADRFQIVNSSGGSEKSPFLVDAGVTYINDAVIRSLDAGKITAGIITANIRMTAGEITGSGYQVVGRVGMRSDSNDGTLTITGGTDNGVANGAQMDLVGTSAGGGVGGVAQLMAGNTSTGHVYLKTGNDNANLTAHYNGSVGINTTTPDASYKLDINGATKANGNIVTSGDILKITGDNYTVPMYDGSNYLETKWDDGYWIRIDKSNEPGNVKEIALIGDDVTFNSVNTTSSERYKKNIRTLVNSLDIIDNLHPKIYDRKDGSRIDEMGLIAESVYEVLPNVVCKNKDGSIEGLDYSKLIPVLLASIKELKARIEILENK